jgi:hypothetical protein
MQSKIGLAAARAASYAQVELFWNGDGLFVTSR